MVAAELRAAPSLLGAGPITGDDGSGVGTGVATLGSSIGAVLHAATKVAAAPDIKAASQKRRGAAVKGSCLIVDGM